MKEMVDILSLISTSFLDSMILGAVPHEAIIDAIMHSNIGLQI
jgi:hypothetical protein